MPRRNAHDQQPPQVPTPGSFDELMSLIKDENEFISHEKVGRIVINHVKGMDIIQGLLTRIGL